MRVVFGLMQENNVVKQIWNTLAIVTGVFVLTAHLSACTIFVVVHNGKTYFCNNEDFNKPGFVWFSPASPGKFGRVNFGFDDRFAQGSMNEKGLAFDSTALQKVPWTANPDLESPRNLIEKILDECRTVGEAIAYFQKYNCRHLAEGQFLFADASGDAAVIAWLPESGLSITRIRSGHLLTTNNRLEASGYRCQRFVKAEQVLARTEPEDVDGLAAVLDAVHQRGPGGFTSYSYIFDLQSCKIRIHNLANFEESIELDLASELSKPAAAPRPLAQLFKNSPTLDEVRAGEQRVNFDTQIVLSDEQLNRFAGIYSPETNAAIELRVSAEDGVLFLENPGQPPARLFPESNTVFRVAPDRGQVSFQFDEHNDQQVTTMILHKASDSRAVRVFR